MFFKQIITPQNKFTMRLLLLISIFTFSLIACKSKAKEMPKPATNISVVQNIRITDIPEVFNSTPDVKFLDVRTPEETAEGVINGAIKIDFRGDKFEEKLDQLDKEKSYIVYCKSGGRSSKTAEIMKQTGFKSIYNLEGGYSAFKAAE